MYAKLKPVLDPLHAPPAPLKIEEMVMFVKITWFYKWYGKHQQISYVGPFLTEEEATAWKEQFRGHIWSGYHIETEIVPEDPRRQPYLRYFELRNSLNLILYAKSPPRADSC